MNDRFLVPSIESIKSDPVKIGTDPTTNKSNFLLQTCIQTINLNKKKSLSGIRRTANVCGVTVGFLAFGDFIAPKTIRRVNNEIRKNSMSRIFSVLRDKYYMGHDVKFQLERKFDFFSMNEGHVYVSNEFTNDSLNLKYSRAESTASSGFPAV